MPDNNLMLEQQDHFFEEPDEIEDVAPLPEQHEPLPPKPPLQVEKKPHLKRVQIVRETQYTLYRPFKLEKRAVSEEEEDEQTKGYDSPFTEFYSPEQCVYMRFNNSSFNRVRGKTYYAGVFANRNIFADLANNPTHEVAEILSEYYDVPQPILPPSTAKPLLFDSRFESGNLFAAFRVGEFEYDLAMSNDTNSTGSNQWFYFSVEGLKPNKEYTLSVINFTKTDALFNYGMKPVVYSLAENRGEVGLERGWRRAGTEVSYKRGKLPRQCSSRMYYRLTFKISTVHSKDKLFIAHSYPYTLEKLQLYLSDKKARNKELVTRVEIGKTMAKRTIEGLLISYPINKKRDTRKAVVITARQHPGQCQGSYVCEGVVDRLLSKTKEAEFLLKNYVIVVIPMVNPDGVVFGHYRTNLAGKDLNRKWNASEKDPNCPEVTAVKAYLSQLSQTRQIRFILDLHGHSRKLNSFFYGNPCPQCPEAVRIFPFVCSKLHMGVQYLDCTFATEQYKRKAARVYLNYLYKLVHVYTFQSSFFCYEKEGSRIEFTPKEYRQLGGTLVTGLFLQLEHDFKYQQSVSFSLKKNTSKEYIGSAFVKYLLELKGNRVLMEVGEAAESGSDSKPEEGQINNEELEYTRMMRLPSPSLPKQSISKSTRAPRKANSQTKQTYASRPTRNLRLLQISKINSFMPDKNFCLQPIRKVEPQSTPKKVLKTAMSSQTETIDCEELAQFQLVDIENANLSYSFVTEQTAGRKNPSVMRSLHIKNNIIFKMDYPNARPQRQVYQQTQTQRRKATSKNALSQTILTFAKLIEKEMRTSMLPGLETPPQEQSEPILLRSAQIKLETPMGAMLVRKEDDNYFNNMVRRFLQNKEKSKSKSFHTPANRSVLDKSFTIKRKQSRK